jgi:hypothetical protein
MTERTVGDARVSRCPDGHGVFLERADLGALVEAETDWHERSVHDTARLPRITPDMTAPPLPPAPRGWVETLFD